MAVREAVYAPFGDDPLLLHDVTIRNVSRTTRRVSWFEYWDVNPYDQTHGFHRGLERPRWTAATRTLSVAQTPDHGDTRPLALFAAALRGPVGGHATSVAAFFGGGSRARPAAVTADRLDAVPAPATASGAVGGTLFAFRAPLRLAPGRSVTLRYAYGLAHPARIPALVVRPPACGGPVRAQRARLGRVAPAGGLRRRPGVGRAGARVGRLPAPRRVGLRRGVRPPHDHAGRVLPVLDGSQPRVPQLAPLPPPDDLRGPEPRPRDPALRDDAAAAPARAAALLPLRHRSAVHLRGPRHVRRPRRLAAPGGRAVRARVARHAVLRRAPALPALRAVGSGVAAREARLPPPGVAARAAWRLPRRLDRGLVRLLGPVPRDERVAAHRRAARLRLSAARRARRPSPRPGVRDRAATARRGAPRRPARRPDRRRVVPARVRRRRGDRARADLRRAAAVGDPRRRPLRRPVHDPRRPHPALPDRRRRAGRRPWAGADRVGDGPGLRRPRPHRARVDDDRPGGQRRDARRARPPTPAARGST